MKRTTEELEVIRGKKAIKALENLVDRDLIKDKDGDHFTEVTEIVGIELEEPKGTGHEVPEQVVARVEARERVMSKSVVRRLKHQQD